MAHAKSSHRFVVISLYRLHDDALAALFCNNVSKLAMRWQQECMTGDASTKQIKEVDLDDSLRPVPL